ncbi:hypothetical protein XI25_10380, partial [Paenibacillus sp. DMB20]
KFDSLSILSAKNETKANRQKSQLSLLLISFYALFLACGTQDRHFRLIKLLNWILIPVSSALMGRFI